MHKAFDERLGVVEIGIFQSRPVHPKRTTTRSRQSYIVVIAKTARQESRHVGADLEADSDPRSFCGAVKRRGCRLRSSKSEKILSSKPGHDHLKIVRRHGEEGVCSFAVATPDFFNEGMVRPPDLETYEVVFRTLCLVRTRTHSVPHLPRQSWNSHSVPAGVLASPGGRSCGTGRAGDCIVLNTLGFLLAPRLQREASAGHGIISSLKTASKTDLYRKLPSVDEVLRRDDLAKMIAREGRGPVTDAARVVLEGVRKQIDAGLDHEELDRALSRLADAITRQLQSAVGYSLRPVVNATGVILHTNLGRAPLPASALENIARATAGYSNLEFDLATGERGKRDVHADRLFQRLFQDESREGRDLSTIVVNNNAAAVWLALNTLAAGGEVIVSRGELVEIGGSFRIPDVMAQSNGILREVGTTNRTRISDYEQAINEKTRLLLRVHRSNFQITGFTEQPALEELVALARARKIPLVEDLGSGALFDLRTVGISGETGVAESLRAGVDVVTYSGDKLLGGPQAGMLTGRADLIARMRKNSLFRALRVDKLTYAALEAALLEYVKGDHSAIPALRMMRASKEEVGTRAKKLAAKLRDLPALEVQVVDGQSVIGGGAAPSSTLPTRLLAVAVKGLSPDEVLARLRSAQTPVIARVQDGRVLLDLRTVFAGEEPVILAAFAKVTPGNRP